MSHRGKGAYSKRFIVFEWFQKVFRELKNYKCYYAKALPHSYNRSAVSNTEISLRNNVDRIKTKKITIKE